ncbi:MAG: ABC transporter permease [Candidatus Bathyarchaeota archaeon]|nr:ABC transporter permease [Candidatus Bathyarchaeota archaeon]
MSETAFPVNDLFRRRLQTGLTVLALTTCVASTLFLLLFSGQIGFGISAVGQDTLTQGTSKVFAQFLTFVGALIFIVGAVIVSFIVFLMMAQRTKDFGLMKATGCPNNLVFGYFMTELLGVTFFGCLLGVIVGFAVDYAVINLSAFQVYNQAPNFWFAPLVFATFFAFALIFGAKPILNAARMSPMKALSSVQYFGLAKGTTLKPLSKTGLTIRIANRSLFRRKNATVRIAIFLSVVFLLLTVSIAGGIMANDTSSSWVQKAIGENVVLVAKGNMATQYTQLLLTYSGSKANLDFDYADDALAIPDAVSSQLSQIQGVLTVDRRLVWYGEIQELGGYMIDVETQATYPVGDERKGMSLIVGLEGGNVVSEPFMRGDFLNANSSSDAVVGDSLAYTVYASYTTGVGGNRHTVLGDALRESIKIQGVPFKITGICLDPINNGNVTYLPLDRLENITGISNPNVLLLKIDPAADYSATVNRIQNALSNADSNLALIELNQTLDKNAGFLGSLWGVIMFLPAFALAAATLCLISFQMLTIDEQHQEFAVLRATGAKPRTIVSILAVQSLTVLLASFGVGVSLGTIICILVLISNPVVSAFTVLSISGWLLTALFGMFLLSLYPAWKFAKKPLLEIMS